MMQLDRSSLATCIKMCKMNDYMMTPSKKSFFVIWVDPSPSVTSHIKSLFWLQVSSYIEETGYVMQPDRRRLPTCIKLHKIYDYMMTPG